MTFGVDLPANINTLFTVSVYMKLARADNSRQFEVFLQGKPYLMIDTILIKQLSLQVRAHVGCINSHHTVIAFLLIF